MSALTSLLVRDRVVSVSKIEEALHYQVLAGGDIETVLLEMNLVPEDVLAAYRAALFGLLPATREEVMRASREALRQLTRESARSLGVVPILFEGRALVVAAAEPLPEESARQIRAELRCELGVRIVTQLRLAAGLAHHYGFELEGRLRRLVDALRKRDAGIIPYVRPPSLSLKPSLRPAGANLDLFAVPKIVGPELSDDDGGPEGDEYTTSLPAPETQDSDRLAGESDPGPDFETTGGMLRSAPAFAAPADVAEPLASAGASSDRTRAVEQVVQEVSVQPVVASLAIPPPAPDLPPVIERGLNLKPTERASTQPPSTVSPHIVRALRGPISEERANKLFTEATSRDDVLFTLLRYTQQFFDFVGIFSVGKEGARGRMAHGAGLTSELMEHVVVPLDGAGVVARAVRDKRVLVGDLGAVDEERAAFALLGRPVGRPGVAVPIQLANRVALVVYADRDGEGVSPADFEPLKTVLPAVSEALRRLILEQKTLRSVASSPPAQARRSMRAHEAGLAVAEPEAVGPAASPAPEPALEDGVRSEELAHGAEPVAVGPELQPPSGDVALGPVGELDAGSTDFTRMANDLDLTAVDLDAMARAPWGGSRRREPGGPIAANAALLSPELREAARGRVPGVPRSAPPPPVHESAFPPAAAPSLGAYSFVAPAGAVVEEIVRPRHVAPAASSAATAREAQEVVPELPSDALELIEGQATAREVAVPRIPREALARDAQRAAAREATPTHAQPSLAPNARAGTKLSLVAPEAPVPSVIIDMGEHVNALVESLMRASPDDALAEIGELLKVGEAVLPVLLQHFPGPLWLDPKHTKGRKLRGRDVSALARALYAFGGRAAPYLASKLATSDTETCRHALMVAGEIVHADLLDAVARRAFDTHEGLRALALEVLRNYAALPQFEAVLRAMGELSERPGKDPRRQRLAVEALGELRDPRALRALLPRLSDANEAIVQAAHKALVVLTGQDFGLAQRKWEAWAEQWSGMRRAEWLIESLLHPDENVRATAGEELKQLTQQYFGYHPALPKRDRELAQRKYREWWETEGRTIFTR